MKDHQDCWGTTLTDQVKGWRKWVGLLSFFGEKKTWRVIEEAALAGPQRGNSLWTYGDHWWRSYTDQPSLPLHHHSAPGTVTKHVFPIDPWSHALGSCVPFLPSPRCPALTPPWYCESCIPVVMGTTCQRGGWYSYHSHRVPSSQEPAQPRQKPQLGRLSTFNKPLFIFLRSWLLELMPYNDTYKGN